MGLMLISSNGASARYLSTPHVLQISLEPASRVWMMARRLNCGENIGGETDAAACTIADLESSAPNDEKRGSALMILSIGSG